MAEILTETADYEEIREHLGVSSAELPDSAITRSSILGAAEVAVKKAIPRWETLPNETDELLLKVAAVHYVCYLLAPRLKLILAQMESDNKTIFTRFKGIDLETVGRYHYGQYKATLKGISVYTSSAVTDSLVSGHSPDFDPVGG